MATENRWGRAIGASVLAELLLVVLVMATIFVYAKTITGPHQTPDRMKFVHDVAAWIELILGPIVLFLFTRWALRPLASAHMAHVLVIAGISLGVHVGLFRQAISEGHIALWISASAGTLKVAAAVAAGLLARRNASMSPTIAS